jgi:hypothetical protein
MLMLKKVQSACSTTGAPLTGMLAAPFPRAGSRVSDGWKVGARLLLSAPAAGEGLGEEALGAARVGGAACRCESIAARSAYHLASREVPRVVTRYRCTSPSGPRVGASLSRLLANPPKIPAI